jgi:hypothetical protein
MNPDCETCPSLDICIRTEIDCSRLKQIRAEAKADDEKIKSELETYKCKDIA